MALVLRSDCCPCIGDTDGRNPCAKKMRVDYEWSAPCADLDTATTYASSTAGWSCDNGDNPQFVSNDNTGCGGKESIEIEISPEVFTQYVNLSAKWYEGRRPSEGGDCPDDCCDKTCPITITVRFCGAEGGEETQTKVVTTGEENSSCASGNDLAVVEIYEDGTWALI